MNPSTLLGIATRALNGNLTGLQVTGNNIANVNTRGYSRQLVQVRNTGADPDLSRGTPVDQTTVVRAHNAYLARQVTLTTAVASADAARSDKLALIEPIFASGDNGIGASLNSMIHAFGDVAAAPTDVSVRQVVLARMDETAARFRDASARLDLVAQGLNDEISTAVQTVNTYAQQIARLNAQIAVLRGRGPDPHELLDQRDQLVDSLNEILQTSTVDGNDGSVNLFVGGSQPLVLGVDALRLSTSADRFDPSWLSLNIETAKGDVALDLTRISGGSLAGLWRFQRDDMIDARSQIGRLATAMTQAMNQAHALGIDLAGQAGKPLFYLPDASVGLPARDNLGSADVRVTPLDASQYAASDYELKLDSGQWHLRRLSDGLSSSFAATESALELDGLRIEIENNKLQAGDRVLLRPFSAAASQVQSLLRSPAALAVAVPVAASAAAANRGDAAVSAITAVSADPALRRTATLTANAAGGFDVSSFDGNGTPVSFSVPFVAGQPVRVNGWALSLNGQPAVGDRFTVQANASGRRDAGQVAGFLALRDQPVFDGATLANGYAAVLSQVGARIQAARISSDTSAAMAKQAAQSESSVSGVNLEEEAALLMQYQQAYQAAARVLQTADNVFRSLMSGIGQ